MTAVMTEDCDVLIVGAGLSGLSVAYELQKKIEIKVIVVEKENSCGASWRQMPHFLKLISPWYCNRPKASKKFRSPFYRMAATEYADELTQLAKDQGFDIRLREKVTALSEKESVVTVTTSKKNYQARWVILAGGYFSFPFIPDYPGLNETSILCLHFKDYKDQSSLGALKKVLIVGKRISAGQLMLELEGKAEVSLSVKSPVSYGPVEWVWGILFPIYPLLEKLASLLGVTREVQKPSMFGGRTQKLVGSKKVVVYPDIQKIYQNDVEFTDGQRVSFDAIVFATGFEFSKDLCQFENLEHVWTLGKEGQFDYRSRFLRGIREDAQRVAQKICNAVR